MEEGGSEWTSPWSDVMIEWASSFLAVWRASWTACRVSWVGLCPYLDGPSGSLSGAHDGIVDVGAG